MRRVLAALGAVLLLVGCGAGALPSPSIAAPLDSPASPTPTSSASTTVTPSTPPTTTAPPTTTVPPTTTAETAPPAKPTGVTFTTDIVEIPRGSGTDAIPYEVTHIVRWESPRADGVEVTVYGVTECLSEPSSPPPGTDGPCLVEHTLLPPAAMALAGTAPAAAGEISWIAAFPIECGGGSVGVDGTIYRAVVISAYNAVDNSIFAIADPGLWWRAGPEDIIC